MAKRPFPDPTKADIAVVTMAYQDYFFVKKWYDYYSALIDPKHLYIVSHDNDPEHRRLAPDANIIGLHRDPGLFRLDRRRWSLLSQISNGLLFYFNWVVCTDVDEIVIVDPDTNQSLPDYIMTQYERGSTPKSICPLGLELIHNPKHEPEPLEDDVPVLSRRRVFRINANYSKPCIVRSPMHFTVGGHANNHLPRVLSEDLYLIHMRFFDYERTKERLNLRRDMRASIDIGNKGASKSGAWSKDLENYEAMSSREPEMETIEFPEFRETMINRQKLLHNDTVAFWGGGRTKTLYRLPDRFTSVF